MANIKSSKKDIRRIEKRRLVNRARKSKIKAAFKNVKVMVAIGNKDRARVAFIKAEGILQRMSHGPVIAKIRREGGLVYSPKWSKT